MNRETVLFCIILICNVFQFEVTESAALWANPYFLNLINPSMVNYYEEERIRAQQINGNYLSYFSGRPNIRVQIRLNLVNSR